MKIDVEWAMGYFEPKYYDFLEALQSNFKEKRKYHFNLSKINSPHNSQ